MRELGDGGMAGMVAPTEAAKAQCLFKHQVLFLELEISAIRQCLKRKANFVARPLSFNLLKYRQMISYRLLGF